jgi:hypothetical protein
MVALVRQSIFSRPAGYGDAHDAKRLAVDPTMRQVVGGRAPGRTTASTSQMGRFETEVLTQPGNLTVSTKLSGKWIDRLREHKSMPELILDHGQFGQRDLWRAGRHGIQRAFRLHLLELSESPPGVREIPCRQAGIGLKSMSDVACSRPVSLKKQDGRGLGS